MRLPLPVICVLLATCSSVVADVFQFIDEADNNYFRNSEVMVVGESANRGSTDTFGKIRIDGLPPGPRWLRIRVPGQKTWRMIAVQFDGQNNVKVYRVPVPALSPSGAGPVRFNAIWTKAAANDQALWAWARDHFEKRFIPMRSQGYQLNDLNAFVVPGIQGERYNAIWTKTAEDRPAVWVWAPEHFEKIAPQYREKGYQLACLNAFVLEGCKDQRYNAVWSKGLRDQQRLPPLRKDQLDEQVKKMRSQGYQLENVSAFVLPGGQGERYNAVWARTPDERPAVWGRARADFDKEAEKRRVEGYKFTCLNAFVLPGNQGERFNAVWTKTPEDRPVVWGWAPADFEREHAKWQKEGYGLAQVNAFVLAQAKADVPPKAASCRISGRVTGAAEDVKWAKRVAVYDVRWKLVKEGIVAGDGRYDVADLAPGTYLVKPITGGKSELRSVPRSAQVTCKEGGAETVNFAIKPGLDEG